MNPQPPPYGPWVPQVPPPPPPRRAASLVPVVLVAVLLVGAVGAGGFLWGSTTRPSGAVGTEQPTASAAVSLGDERAVDPCGLLGVEAMARFGTSERFPDYGVLTSCRIDLTTPSGELIGVESYLDSASYVEEFTGDREVLGDLQIRRPAPSDTFCDRLIVLADGTAVELLVTRTAAGATDLCAVADAAALSAAVRLTDTTPLPTRTLPAPSDRLAALDVCALPADAALQSVPGLDVTRRAVAFGGWGCTWGSLSDTWFRVTGVRSGPYEETGAVSSTVGGRQVWTTDDSATRGLCEMAVVLETYVGSTGNPRVDVMSVQLASSADPCGQLGRLLPDLVAALPA